MKKILLINNGYPSKTNQQYTAYIKSIKECLEESGQKVDLLVMYAVFGSSPFLKIVAYIKYYIKLFLFYKYNEYDFVYINNYPHSFLPLIFKLKKMNNLIIHWHGEDIFAEKKHSVLLNKLSYQFIPKSALHIAPSHYFADAVAKTLKIPIESIFVSPSGGVDTHIFIPHKKQKEGFHIGFASHVSKEKGFDLFARLIDEAETIEINSGFKLFFHYISYGAEKEFYSAKLKDNQRVNIYNIYPKEQMPNFYSEIDLLLLSTRLAESLGLVSLEAMSCGVPVVGTDAFALKEYIISEKTGELFEIINYEEIVKAIVKVIKNNSQYKPREFILEKYSKDSVVFGYKEYFGDK